MELKDRQRKAKDGCGIKIMWTFDISEFWFVDILQIFSSPDNITLSWCSYVNAYVTGQFSKQKISVFALIFIFVNKYLFALEEISILLGLDNIQTVCLNLKLDLTLILLNKSMFYFSKQETQKENNQQSKGPEINCN